MSQGKYDWSTFTDDDSAMDIYGNTIRKSIMGDAYNANTRFKAVALTDMFPLTSQQAMAIDGGSTGGSDNANKRWAFKGRVIGDNSPHSFLPNPCDPSDGLVDDEKAYRVIAMHTTFISTMASAGDNVTRGDIVLVELDKSEFSYDLKYGRLIGLTSVENPTDTEGTQCANLVGLVGEWGGHPPATPAGSPAGAVAGTTAYASSACKDATPASADWKQRALWGVVAREGKSKTWTDVTPLGGGLIGVAHFVGDGLYRLYDAMGDDLATKYFGKTVAELTAFSKERNNCVGSTPKNHKCKPQHKCCYVVDWWREGMVNFTKSEEGKAAQWKAWEEKVGAKAEALARAGGWTTGRQFAIAAGVANSLGRGGFKELAAKHGWDAEKVAKAYITEGGHESGHRRRRIEAVNKYFPCDPTTAPKIDLSSFPSGVVPEATPEVSTGELYPESDRGVTWDWLDESNTETTEDKAFVTQTGKRWVVWGPPQEIKEDG